MKRHPPDFLSLTFGLILLGVATLWLVAQFVDIRLSALGWVVLAGGLIVVGVIWAVLRSQARRR